ncbi:MAG: hypothetical protein VKJ04_00035 [Vampirovibrionales bacterium]|nr:hypothetical protein [Vampirovibrionales bacterium]
MMRPLISLPQVISLTLLAGLCLGGSAFADCNADKQEAMALVRNMKSVAASGDAAKAQAASDHLSKLMDRMSSQSCDTQVLDVYRMMQREGIQAR